MDIKEVAKEIRTVLKSAFPATKFSVTIKRFSMGESVDTSWIDGPTKTQVNELIGKYGDTRYRFINTSRQHSIEFADKAIKAWKEQNPKYALFAITSQGKVNCYGIEIDGEFNSNDDIQDCEDSIYKFLRNSTLDSLSLATPPENTDCKPETVSIPEPQPELVEVATETASQPQPNQLNLIEQPAAVACTVSMKDALQKAWDKAEAEYTANPTPNNYRNLEEKVKAYELGYMLFGQDDQWTTPETTPQLQEPARNLTLELIDLQELLISKMEEISQLKLKIAELQVERDAAKHNQQQPQKAKIAQIILTRDEGTIAESGTSVVVTTTSVIATAWLEAEQSLKQWAATVSSPTRADKCRIVFKFADGKSFKLNSFGLMQQHRFKINLAQELLTEIQYMAGEKIPEHMTQEDYQNYCKFCKIEPANYKRLLNDWDIPA